MSPVDLGMIFGFCCGVPTGTALGVYLACWVINRRPSTGLTVAGVCKYGAVIEIKESDREPAD